MNHLRQWEIPPLVIVSEGKGPEKTTQLRLQGKCQAAACEENSRLLEVMAARLQNAREIGRVAVLAEREQGKKAQKEEQRRRTLDLKREMQKVAWEREEGKKTLKEEQKRANADLKREQEKIEWMRKNWAKNVEMLKSERESRDRDVEEWNKNNKKLWKKNQQERELGREEAQRQIRMWKEVAKQEREKADKRWLREGKAL